LDKEFAMRNTRSLLALAVFGVFAVAISGCKEEAPATPAPTTRAASAATTPATQPVALAPGRRKLGPPVEASKPAQVAQTADPEEEEAEPVPRKTTKTSMPGPAPYKFASRPMPNDLKQTLLTNVKGFVRVDPVQIYDKPITYKARYVLPKQNEMKQHIQLTVTILKNAQQAQAAIEQFAQDNASHKKYGADPSYLRVTSVKGASYESQCMWTRGKYLFEVSCFSGETTDLDDFMNAYPF
jgi:hypothetical protein